MIDAPSSSSSESPKAPATVSRSSSLKAFLPRNLPDTEACGIIGLFTVPIILGPIAIVQANKAERLGAAATAVNFFGGMD
ncbi:hypothetical protein ACFP6B_06565 [Rothia nasimurium]|uniref:hypothetical protein n=1 Tax=Rothia nasimurium TaxID=85336 RepID=UPI003613EBC1